jgi:hypothetical protein
VTADAALGGPCDRVMYGESHHSGVTCRGSTSGCMPRASFTERPVPHPQQTAASHRARELYPDGAARMRPAVAGRRYHAANSFIDTLLAADPRPSAQQLRALAQRLLDAADGGDAE